MSSRVPGWRDRWLGGAFSEAALTGQHLDQIAALDPGYLRSGHLRRMADPPGERGFGMCGRLTAYRPLP